MMRNILKRFEVWVINSNNNLKHNPFLLARLKLTAYYTFGILIILVIFILAVYGFFSFNENEVLDLEKNKDTELEQREEFEERLENALVITGCIFSVAIAGLSFKFAGITMKPIEAAYKKQNEFVADSAHELRTPLAVMKAGIENTLDHNTNMNGYKKMLEETLEEVDFLTSTVNDLLLLAHFDNSKITASEKLDLKVLVTKEIENLKPIAEQNRIILKLESEDSTYLIPGNKSQIKRLLTNLIQNSIEYSNPHGYVIISLNHSNQKVELSITDNGIGISQKDLKYIFNRFYKADKSRTKISSGAGLGLAIVKEIIKTHQAEIKIKSKLNQGTTISVLFPSL